MMTKPEQVAAAGKAQLDASMRFATIAAEGAEKLLDLQFRNAKAAFDEIVKNAKRSPNWRCIANHIVGRNKFPTRAGQGTAYARSFYDVATGTQGEIGALLEEQVDEFNKTVSVALDAAFKTAPPGSEAAVAAAKSVIEVANSVYETIAKATKQLTSMTEPTLQPPRPERKCLSVTLQKKAPVSGAFLFLPRRPPGRDSRTEFRMEKLSALIRRQQSLKPLGKRILGKLLPEIEQMLPRLGFLAIAQQGGRSSSSHSCGRTGSAGLLSCATSAHWHEIRGRVGLRAFLLLRRRQIAGFGDRGTVPPHAGLRWSRQSAAQPAREPVGTRTGRICPLSLKPPNFLHCRSFHRAESRVRDPVARCVPAKACPHGENRPGTLGCVFIASCGGADFASFASSAAGWSRDGSGGSLSRTISTSETPITSTAAIDAGICQLRRPPCCHSRRAAARIAASSRAGGSSLAALAVALGNFRAIFSRFAVFRQRRLHVRFPRAAWPAHSASGFWRFPFPVPVTWRFPPASVRLLHAAGKLRAVRRQQGQRIQKFRGRSGAAPRRAPAGRRSGPATWMSLVRHRHRARSGAAASCGGNGRSRNCARRDTETSRNAPRPDSARATEMMFIQISWNTSSAAERKPTWRST